MEVISKQKSKNKFGQYFTPEVVADFMIGLADVSKTAKILEPSCGEGIFLDLLQQKGFQNISAYEIDESLATDFDFIRYESFVSAQIDEKFNLIIGNPPYIRWANLEDELKQELLNNHLWNQYFNSLCDYLYIFILKSIELLEENGQLIFICPEYWLNTTHSITLRNYMVMNGYFEEIYHFNETPIFDKVTVSIIIFKYVKQTKKLDKNHPEISITKFYSNQKLTKSTISKLKNKEVIEDAEYLSISPFNINERWILGSDELKSSLKDLELNCQKREQNTVFSLFEDENKSNYYTIGDFCEIGNGLVSGLDKAFQLNGHPLNEFENQAILKVIKAKDIRAFYHDNITKYIFLNDGLSEIEFNKNYPNFYVHLQEFRDDLNKRYQYNRKINYWEWVFLRNFNLFSQNEKRIFVPCKERISNKNYFRFALVDAGIFPTQDVTAIFKKKNTKESIEYILAYLNYPKVFEWLKYNGIVKGNIVEFSEKPIASIPFRAIEWKNKAEVEMHDKIVEFTNSYISSKQNEYLNEIQNLFCQLLNTKC